MEKTRTEQLLEQAQAICQRVTKTEDVDAELLRVVFMSLDMEQPIGEPVTHDGATLH